MELYRNVLDFPDRCTHYMVGDVFIPGDENAEERIGFCALKSGNGKLTPVDCEGHLCRCPYRTDPEIRELLAPQLRKTMESLRQARGVLQDYLDQLEGGFGTLL